MSRLLRGALAALGLALALVASPMLPAFGGLAGATDLSDATGYYYDAVFGSDQMASLTHDDPGNPAAVVQDGVLANGGAHYAGMGAADVIADAYQNGYVRVEDLHGLGISRDDFEQAVLEASNSGEYYYVDVSGSSHTWTEADGIITGFDVAYLVPPEELPALKAEFEDRVTYALSWVDDQMTDAEKAQALHDFLVRCVSYDEAEAQQEDGGEAGDPFSHTAYGALVRGSAVCDGYAMAYRLLLGRAGVEAVVVVSDDMDHSWNMVRVDGAWYHVDVTYDDPMPDQGAAWDPGHEFFLLSDDQISNAVDEPHYGWRMRNDVGDLPQAPDPYPVRDDEATAAAGDAWPTEYDGPCEPEAVPVQEGFFTTDDGRTYYAEGGQVARGERLIDGSWYYFNETSGIMAQARFANLPTKCCYYDEDGRMLYGLLQVGEGGDRYWLDPLTGAMARAALVDLPDGRTCYFDDDGIMAVGEVACSDGTWRCFDPQTGDMVRNSFEQFVSDGRICYYGPDGVRAAGWVTVDGFELYFDPQTGALDEDRTPGDLTFTLA